MIALDTLHASNPIHTKALHYLALHTPFEAIALILLVSISGWGQGASTYNGINYKTLLKDFQSSVKLYGEECKNDRNLWRELYFKTANLLAIELKLEPIHQGEERIRNRWPVVNQDREFDFHNLSVKKWKYILELRAWAEMLEEYGPNWYKLLGNKKIFEDGIHFFNYYKPTILRNIEYGNPSKKKLSAPPFLEEWLHTPARTNAVAHNGRLNLREQMLQFKNTKRELKRSAWWKTRVKDGERPIQPLSEGKFYELRHDYNRGDWVDLQQARAWNRFMAKYPRSWLTRWALQDYPAIPVLSRYPLSKVEESNIEKTYLSIKRRYSKHRAELCRTEHKYCLEVTPEENSQDLLKKRTPTNFLTGDPLNSEEDNIENNPRRKLF